MSDDLDRIKVLEERVRSLDMQMARYKGVIGTLVLIVSAVGFVFEVVWPFLAKKMGG